MLEIFTDTFFSTVFLSLILFLVIGFAAYEIFLYSKRNNLNFSISFFSVGMRKRQEKKKEDELFQQIQAIEKKMGIGDGPIEIDALHALYVAQNFPHYNLVSAESGKVIFEPLKKVVVNIDPNAIEAVEESQKPNVEFLEGGITRLYQKTGYTDFKDGVIVGSKIFDDVKPVVSKQKSAERGQKEKEILVAAQAIEEEDLSSPLVIVKTEHEDIIEDNVSTGTIVENFPDNQKEGKDLIDLHSVRDENLDKPFIQEQIVIEERPIELLIEDKKVMPEHKLDYFTEGHQLFDPNKVAQLVSGSKEKEKAAVVPPYYVSYPFENIKSFFNKSIFSEEGTIEKKYGFFLKHLFLHQNIFSLDSDKTIYVHVDSFILAFLRIIEQANKEAFLNYLYEKSGELKTSAFNELVSSFNNKTKMFFDIPLITGRSIPQSSERTHFFPRAIKVNGKVLKSEFLILSMKNEFELVMNQIDISSMKKAELITNNPQEYEQITGKTIKNKLLEEMRNEL